VERDHRRDRWSVSAVIIARMTAKRQDGREDKDDESKYRGELREDNKTLRQEVWDLKRALGEKEKECEDLREQLRQAREARANIVDAERKQFGDPRK
jgi:chromosome segregation ATPase